MSNQQNAAPEVSFAKNYSFGNHQHIDLSRIYSDYIRNPAADHVAAIEGIREYAQKNSDRINDPDVKREIADRKARLPAFTWSGTFDKSKGVPKNNTLLQHSGRLQIDIDGKDNPQINPQLLRDLLGKDPHIEAAFISPTAFGVKCGLSIPVCTSEADHKEASFAAAHYFKTTYGVEIDPSCKDLRRICYLSFDPQLVINPNPVPLDIKKWWLAGLKQQLLVPARPQLLDDDLDNILSRIQGYDDYTTWITVGHAIKQHYGDAGYDSWAKWSAQSQKWYAENDGQNRARWESFKPTNIRGAEVLNRMAAVTIGNLHQRRNRSGDLVKIPNMHNVRESLTLRKEPIWYDDFLQRVLTTLGSEKDTGPVEWSDELNTNLTIAFQNDCEGFRMLSDKVVAKAVTSYAHLHKRNCLTEWLDSLQWDKTPRLDRWLPSYCGAEDNLYTRQAGRCWLLGAVARAYKPGIKFDNCLVLEGRQGVGKSLALEILANGWSVKLKTFDDEKATEHIQGKWIVEIEELDAFRKSEVETIKSFITTAADRYRVKYTKTARDLKRTCVFAGTTNRTDYLRDETGNRRFWPIWCDYIDLEKLRADRDQLLAEAVDRFQAGASLLMSKEALAIAADKQDERYQVDSWEDLITEFCADRDRVSVPEIFEEALHIENKTQWGRPAEMRIAKIMKRLGWEDKRLRIEGSRQKIYLRAA